MVVANMTRFVSCQLLRDVLLVQPLNKIADKKRKVNKKKFFSQKFSLFFILLRSFNFLSPNKFCVIYFTAFKYAVMLLNRFFLTMTQLNDIFS